MLYMHSDDSSNCVYLYIHLIYIINLTESSQRSHRVVGCLPKIYTTPIHWKPRRFVPLCEISVNATILLLEWDFTVPGTFCDKVSLAKHWIFSFGCSRQTTLYHPENKQFTNPYNILNSRAPLSSFPFSRSFCDITLIHSLLLSLALSLSLWFPAFSIIFFVT